MKKTVRREQLQREEVEQKRLKNVLELQYLLDRLGDDSVRQELRQGVGGSALLTDADLSALDEFYKLVGPDRDQNVRWVQGCCVQGRLVQSNWLYCGGYGLLTFMLSAFMQVG